MPTDVELNTLERDEITLSGLREKYTDFYFKLAYILKLARGRGAKYLKFLCRKIAFNSENPNPDDNILQFDFDLLDGLQLINPQAYNEFSKFLRNRCHDGYDNIVSLMLGEAPSEIKGFGKYDEYRKERRR